MLPAVGNRWLYRRVRIGMKVMTNCREKKSGCYGKAIMDEK